MTLKTIPYILVTENELNIISYGTLFEKLFTSLHSGTKSNQTFRTSQSLDAHELLELKLQRKYVLRTIYIYILKETSVQFVVFMTYFDSFILKSYCETKKFHSKNRRFVVTQSVFISAQFLTTITLIVIIKLLNARPSSSKIAGRKPGYPDVDTSRLSSFVSEKHLCFKAANELVQKGCFLSGEGRTEMVTDQAALFERANSSNF